MLIHKLTGQSLNKCVSLGKSAALFFAEHFFFGWQKNSKAD